MIAQAPLVAKSQELHQIVDEILTGVVDAVENHTPIHEVESKTFQTFLRAGRIALQLLVDCLGNGDLGQEHRLPDGKTLQRSAEPQPRPYVSIFGELNIQQYVYAERKGQEIKFAPVAARLALPDSKFSYLLQDWNQNFAMEQPFGNVNETVQKILKLNRDRCIRRILRGVVSWNGRLSRIPPKRQGVQRWRSRAMW
jgi:hypothetical protein